MNILFRCDASVKIGIGHVVRCLALADYLKENYNCNILFAMRNCELQIDILKKSYRIIEPKHKSFIYVKWLSNCIFNTKSDILIMDVRDGLTRKELNSIKIKTGVKIVTFDDPEDKRLESDLAFYPPVPQFSELNWKGYKGKLYVGWDYVLLRTEFNRKYAKSKNKIPNILITMGGTDGNNMIDIVLRALTHVNVKFKAIIIVGPGYKYLLKLKERLESVNYEFELFVKPKKIAQIMSKSDFAIISFGQTAYELAALNIPAIYLCISDDHFQSSKLFMDNNIGVSLGLYSEVKTIELVYAVNSYINNKNIIKDMSICSNLLKISNLYIISSLIVGVNNYDKRMDR